MKTIVKNITIKFSTYLMIGMMGMLITNNAIFTHLHILSDGEVIEHAHPYDKSNDSKPYKSHHHTNAELIFYQNLENIILIVFFTFTLRTLVIKVKYSFPIITRYTQGYIILHKGRAPPIS